MTIIHELRATPESELPDDFVPCCIGSAELGPDSCTCWEPVYSAVQLPPTDHLDVPQRLKCCHDCAFRNGSPERQEDDSAMDEITSTAGRRFFCHQGMRRVIEYVHPDGRRKPAEPGSFEPAQDGLVAFKADGTPAELCAGWKAQKEKLQRTLVGGDTDLPGGCVGVTSGESGDGIGRVTSGEVADQLRPAASPDPLQTTAGDGAGTGTSVPLLEEGASGALSSAGAVSGGRPDKHDERTAP